MKEENCVYCGEKPYTKEIEDPNGGLKNWKVCEGCEKVIIQQQKLSFGHFIGRKEYGKKYGAKMIIEAEQELKRLSEEEGLDSFTAHITKKVEEKI